MIVSSFFMPSVSKDTLWQNRNSIFQLDLCLCDLCMICDLLWRNTEQFATDKVADFTFSANQHCKVFMVSDYRLD